MTLPDGYIGQRVRTRGGSDGTIKVVSARNHMPFYGVQFDEPVLEWLHFTQLVPASEESMAKTIEQRLNSAERNLVDHEHEIGRTDGRVENIAKSQVVQRSRIEALEAAAKTGEARLELNARRIEEVADTAAQRFDRVEVRANGIAARVAVIEARRALSSDVEEVTARVEALEALIAKDKIGSWRRATEAVGGRLTGHDAALNELRKELDYILETAAGRRSVNEEKLAELEERVERKGVAFNALRIEFDRHVAHARKMSNGPKSYDKRIAALERKIDILKPTFPPTAEAYGERLAALEEMLSKLVERMEKSTDIDVLASHRLGRLEAAVAEKRSENEERLDHASRLVEQLFTRVAALERRDDDPLRRVHWSSPVPVPYSGTGDDATDDCGDLLGYVVFGDEEEDAQESSCNEERHAPDDPASRDVDSLVNQTAMALRAFTNVALVSELLRRVSPHRSK